MNRLIAIGDIHGQQEKLVSLLGLLDLSADDQLIFLGDYVDRGPDTRGVIDTLMDVSETRPNSIFLRGNHEQMLLNALIESRFDEGASFSEIAAAVRGKNLHSDIQHHLQNGGHETLRSYGVSSVADIPREHILFLQRTQLYYQEEGFLFVHAGARNDLPLEEQDVYTLLWDRHLEPGEDLIHVVGHKPTADGYPQFEPGRYSVDTGAGFGRSLSACDVLSKEVWQAF